MMLAEANLVMEHLMFFLELSIDALCCITWMAVVFSIESA